MPKRKAVKKPKPKVTHAVVPVEHLTYIEEVHRASTKAYRAFKKWLKK